MWRWRFSCQQIAAVSDTLTESSSFLKFLFCPCWCHIDIICEDNTKTYFLSSACSLQAASFRRVPSSSSGGVTSARTREWASHTMTWFIWNLRPQWSGPAEQPRLAVCSTAGVRIRAKPTALPPMGNHFHDLPCSPHGVFPYKQADCALRGATGILISI